MQFLEEESKEGRKKCVQFEFFNTGKNSASFLMICFIFSSYNFRIYKTIIGKKMITAPQISKQDNFKIPHASNLLLIKF